MTPLVLCKFGVADALLHSLSCGNSLVFLCAILSIGSAEICLQGAVMNKKFRRVRGRYYV